MTVATAVWTVLCDSFCDTNLTSQLGFLRLIKRDAKSADLDDSSPLRGSNVEQFVLSAPGHTPLLATLAPTQRLELPSMGMMNTPSKTVRVKF
jgi:hypothetical protein